MKRRNAARNQTNTKKIIESGSEKNRKRLFPIFSCQKQGDQPCLILQKRKLPLELRCKYVSFYHYYFER